MNLALIRRSFFSSLFSSLRRAARLACFLGLEVGGKLLLEIFKLHRSFASGLCLMAVHRSQGAGCEETCLSGLGAPEKMCPAPLGAALGPWPLALPVSPNTRAGGLRKGPGSLW